MTYIVRPLVRFQSLIGIIGNCEEGTLKPIVACERHVSIPNRDYR